MNYMIIQLDQMTTTYIKQKEEKWLLNNKHTNKLYGD